MRVRACVRLRARALCFSAWRQPLWWGLAGECMRVWIHLGGLGARDGLARAWLSITTSRARARPTGLRRKHAENARARASLRVRFLPRSS